MTHLPLLMFALSLTLALPACGGAPPSQQADTAPLRSGQQVAQSVGEKTREVQTKNKDLVRYATSIEAKDTSRDEQEAVPGRITVYSKPRGEIVLDGKPQGVFTPETIEADEGQHEMQVIFEGGDTSELKVVRVRANSRIKLFFRGPDTTTPSSSDTEPTPPSTPPATSP